MNDLPTAEKIRALTQHVDPLPVAFDGATRLVSLALEEAGIAHDVYTGKACAPSRKPVVHWWVVLPCREDQFMVDYRLRMWFGDDNIPQGVFPINERGRIVYSFMERVVLDPCNARLLKGAL